MILTFDETAALVAHAVALELADEAEERCGAAQAIAEWVREHNSADVEALAALVGALSADALATLTLGRAA